MKNQNSLKWIIKNSKGEIPKIFILSISNILLALVATVLAPMPVIYLICLI